MEINETLLTNLERTLRFDSEFYKKANLRIQKLLFESKIESISAITKVSDGNHMKVSDKFIELGVPYYRGQNIHDFFIENATPICIDEKTYSDPYMKRSHLQSGDVLLSIVGTIGGVSIVGTNKKATCSCKLAILRPHSVVPNYLAVFLKTSYGQNQIKKFVRGAVQMGLILEDMDQIFVPIKSKSFQGLINDLVIKSKNKINLSKTIYIQAEETLLDEIGLKDFEPSTENINIKNYSSSFATSGRLDAEYYQPKYEDYEQAVKLCSKGFTVLGEQFEHVTIISNKDLPEYKYIEIGDVNVGDGSSSYTIRAIKDLPANAKYIVQKGDLLISKVRPNRGAISIIQFDEDDLIVSGAFTVLRKKQDCVFVVEVLQILLRTEIYKEWMLKFNIGTQYPVIKDTDILNLPIPMIDKKIQEEIKQKLQGSSVLRVKSEKLLDIAKRAVEIAIEEDEITAENYIKIECSKLDINTP